MSASWRHGSWLGGLFADRVFDGLAFGELSASRSSGLAIGSPPKTATGQRPRSGEPVEIAVRPLTPAEWPNLAALFDEGGDPKWCWCTYWRVRGSDFSAGSAVRNRERLRAVAADRPPGLVAYADGRAVGWVSLGPRGEFERLERSRIIPHVDDQPVWSIVCFVVSRQYRNRGVARALLDAAISFARGQGAGMLEAYPVSVGENRVPAAAAYTGTLSMFEAAGFVLEAITRSFSAGMPRVVVRLRLEPGRAGEASAASVQARAPA